MSYESKEKVLFAADGFGKFGALVNETDDWACEARRYYFNICGKYGVQVQNVLKKAAGLDIQTICPLHGPVLEGEAMAEAIRLYGEGDHAGKMECSTLEYLRPGSIKLERLPETDDWFAQDAREMDVAFGETQIQMIVDRLIRIMKGE